VEGGKRNTLYWFRILKDKLYVKKVLWILKDFAGFY